MNVKSFVCVILGAFAFQVSAQGQSVRQLPTVKKPPETVLNFEYAIYNEKPPIVNGVEQPKIYNLSLIIKGDTSCLSKKSKLLRGNAIVNQKCIYSVFKNKKSNFVIYKKQSKYSGSFLTVKPAVSDEGVQFIGQGGQWVESLSISKQSLANVFNDLSITPLSSVYMRERYVGVGPKDIIEEEMGVVFKITKSSKLKY